MMLLLLACSAPIDGTWMFEIDVTAPVGDECSEPDITHNFTGGYVPEVLDASAEWTETDTGELSPSLLFGRIEAVGDGYVLILGNAVGEFRE